MRREFKFYGRTDGKVESEREIKAGTNLEKGGRQRDGLRKTFRDRQSEEQY